MFGIGHQPHLESNSNFTTLIFAFTVQLRSLFCWRLYLEMFVCRSARGVFSQRLASVLCILYMRMTSLINVQNKVRAEENEILKYQAWDIANKWRNVSSPWASVYYWGHCLFHNKTFSWNPSNSHSYQTDHESGTDRYIRAFFFLWHQKMLLWEKQNLSLEIFTHKGCFLGSWKNTVSLVRKQMFCREKKWDSQIKSVWQKEWLKQTNQVSLESTLKRLRSPYMSWTYQKGLWNTQHFPRCFLKNTGQLLTSVKAT